jgi:hypothetical protein
MIDAYAEFLARKATIDPMTGLDNVPPRKLDAVLAAMEAGAWAEAIRLAAKFPRLGPQARAIMQAHEASQRPEFQRQLGRCPAQLIEAGKAALIERYGNAQ